MAGGGAFFFGDAGFATTFLATTFLGTTRFVAVFLAATFFATARFGVAFLATVARRRVEAAFVLGGAGDAFRPAGRRLPAVRAVGRLAFRDVFARGRAVFFDVVDLAVAAARFGRPGVRPVVRLAFALAMTLLVRSPLPQDAGRQRWDVVRLV